MVGWWPKFNADVRECCCNLLDDPFDFFTPCVPAPLDECDILPCYSSVHVRMCRNLQTKCNRVSNKLKFLPLVRQPPRRAAAARLRRPRDRPHQRSRIPLKVRDDGLKDGCEVA